MGRIEMAVKENIPDHQEIISDQANTFYYYLILF